MPVKQLKLNMSRVAWSALAVALAVMVGGVDYLTGPGMSFAVFYLLPVALATWKGGFGGGMLAAVLSTAVWFGAGYLSKESYSSSLAVYWNTGVRFSFFLLTVLLIHKTRRLNLSLQEKAGSLSKQIAERERAEHALAENEKVFRLITENASDLIAVLDLDGRRQYLSPSYKSVLGNTDGMRGSDYFADVAAEDQERVRTALRQTLATGMNQRAEYRLSNGIAPERYLESEWSLIREKEDGPRNVVVVSRDITLRKRLELLYANEKEALELIAQGKPLQEVLRKLINKLSAWSSQIYCSILVRNADQEAVLHVATSGVIRSSERPSETAPADSDFPESELGVNGSGGASANAIEKAWFEYRESAAKLGLQTVCTKAILSTLGEELGLLTIYSRESPESDALGLQLFDKIAHVTAIALERQRSEEMLRRLSSLILDAQEAERRRVARELHDGVNQILSSVAFRVESVIAEIPPESEAIKEEVGKVRFLLQKAIHEIRCISENLRPSELDELGLVAAVRALCEDCKERSRLLITLKAPAASERFSSEIELTLYRIVQEALANIEKHAEATEAVLALNWDSDCITLSIRDNGKGLARRDEARSERKRLGMGLIDMRERCAFLGGSFSIQSKENAGTEIAVRIPKNAAPRSTTR